MQCVAICMSGCAVGFTSDAQAAAVAPADTLQVWNLFQGDANPIVRYCFRSLYLGICYSLSSISFPHDLRFAALDVVLSWSEAFRECTYITCILSCFLRVVWRINDVEFRVVSRLMGLQYEFELLYMYK